MGEEANTKGLLVGRAKKPDTISLAVRGLKFSWGALIFHSFSRRSSPFFLYSAPHAAGGALCSIAPSSDPNSELVSYEVSFKASDIYSTFFPLVGHSSA